MAKMKILIGYDGSSCADAAIDDLQSAGLPRELELLIITVGEAPVVPPLANHEIIEKAFVGQKVISIVNHAKTHIASALSEAKDHACAAKRRLESHFPNSRVRAIAIPGRPATQLVEQAREWAAHLLVVGSQGRSAIGRLILGSVSFEVATNAQCAVRIARRAFNQSAQAPRLVVGLDGSVGSERAIKQVLKRGWPEGTELRIIAVDDGKSAIKIAEVISASRTPSGMIRLAGAKGLKVFAEVIKGDPAEVLMNEAGNWGAECIFIGAGGFGTSAYDSSNSVMMQLAKNASCSVEVVR